MPIFFDKERYVLHYKNLQLYLRLGLKLNKIHRVLESNKSQELKPYVEFNTQKITETKKKWRQKWKSVVQIIEQWCLWQNNGKLKKQNWCKNCKQQKRLFNMDIKTKLYATKNIWQWLVAMHKNKIILTLNKPQYVGLMTLDLIMITFGKNMTTI